MATPASGSSGTRMRPRGEQAPPSGRAAGPGAAGRGVYLPGRPASLPGRCWGAAACSRRGGTRAARPGGAMSGECRRRRLPRGPGEVARPGLAPRRDQRAPDMPEPRPRRLVGAEARRHRLGLGFRRAPPPGTGLRAPALREQERLLLSAVKCRRESVKLVPPSKATPVPGGLGAAGSRAGGGAGDPGPWSYFTA